MSNKPFFLKGAFVLIVLLNSLPSIAVKNCDFNCTLLQHLNAIQEKDFTQFEKTITYGKHLSFILPDGSYFDDPRQFRSMLKGWFEQGGWTFDYTIIKKHQSETLGHALLLVDYNEADRNGKPYHIDHYLSLIFEKQDGQWLLVHDQNTKTELSNKKSAP